MNRLDKPGYDVLNLEKKLDYLFESVDFLQEKAGEKRKETVSQEKPQKKHARK